MREVSSSLYSEEQVTSKSVFARNIQYKIKGNQRGKQFVIFSFLKATNPLGTDIGDQFLEVFSPADTEYI